jgi:hypothetical protein
MSTQIDHAEIKLGQIFTMLMSVAAFMFMEPAYLIALLLRPDEVLSELPS